MNSLPEGFRSVAGRPMARVFPAAVAALLAFSEPARAQGEGTNRNDMPETTESRESQPSQPAWKSEVRRNFENGLRFFRAGNSAYLPELARVTAQSGGKDRAIYLKKLADVASASAPSDAERDFLDSVSAQLELALSAPEPAADVRAVPRSDDGDRTVTVRHERSPEIPRSVVIMVRGEIPLKSHISKWKTVVDSYQRVDASFVVEAGRSVTRSFPSGFELTVSMDERGIVTVSSDDFDDRSAYVRDENGGLVNDDSRFARDLSRRPINKRLRVGDRSFVTISAETDLPSRDGGRDERRSRDDRGGRSRRDGFNVGR